MLSDDQFRTIYQLLDHGQTVDASGSPVDCGVQCGYFCCTGGLTKYLLPGEQEFLERETAQLQTAPFRYGTVQFFDTVSGASDDDSTCMCRDTRHARPFVCRAFPYMPTLEGERVVRLHRNALSGMSKCWINTPGAAWAAAAVQAWQLVIDDDAARMMFARMALLWEWNQALDRGENPGPVLTWLLLLQQHDRAQTFAVANRFFKRTDL